MWKLYLLSAAVVVIVVALMSFNILRGEKFPETEVSRNREMKKLGITCAHEDEMRMRNQLRRERARKQALEKGEDFNEDCLDSCADCAGCTQADSENK